MSFRDRQLAVELNRYSPLFLMWLSSAPTVDVGGQQLAFERN